MPLPKVYRVLCVRPMPERCRAPMPCDRQSISPYRTRCRLRQLWWFNDVLLYLCTAVRRRRQRRMRRGRSQRFQAKGRETSLLNTKKFLLAPILSIYSLKWIAILKCSTQLVTPLMCDTACVIGPNRCAAPTPCDRHRTTVCASLGGESSSAPRPTCVHLFL